METPNKNQQEGMEKGDSSSCFEEFNSVVEDITREEALLQPSPLFPKPSRPLLPRLNLSSPSPSVERRYSQALEKVLMAERKQRRNTVCYGLLSYLLLVFT